jgi:hypothetical protein
VDLKKRRLLGSHYVAVFIKDIWQRYIPQYTLHTLDNTQPREGHAAQNTAVDKIFCANRQKNVVHKYSLSIQQESLSYFKLVLTIYS